MTAFGDTVRALLAERGWSLGELARRSHYNKGYLSKVLNGIKPGSRALAGHLDELLGAGGELAALIPVPVPRPRLYVPLQPRRTAAGDGELAAGDGELAAAIRELNGRLEALTEALSAAAGSQRGAEAGASPAGRGGLYLVPHD